MLSQATLEPIQEADPHPLATALVVGGIALVGAVLFAGSIAAWLILRDTGVDWMFSTVK